MTADRTRSPGLSPPATVEASAARAPDLLIRTAEAVTRYGLPIFIVTLPLEATVELFRIQLARIVLLALALAYGYLVLARRRRVTLPVGTAIAVLAVFALYSLASWALTRAPGSTRPLLDVAAYPVMAVLVVCLSRTEKDHDRAWAALLVSSIGLAILGAFLYYTGLSIWRPDPALLGRVNATFGDPNIMARFQTLAVAVAILMYARRRLDSRLLVAAVVAGAALLPLTFSKSGFLFFPLTVVLAVFVSSNLRRSAALAVLALVVFSAALLINPATRNRSLLVIDTITGTAVNFVPHPASGSAAPAEQPLGGVQLDEVRVYLITAGLAMFEDHPLTGVGFGGFQHALLTRYAGYAPPNPPVTLSHTAAVTILAEEGLVGVVLIGGFLLLLARDAFMSARRRTRWRDLVVIPAFLVLPIVLYSQLEGRFLEEPYLWLALALMYSARTLEKSTAAIELP